MNICLLTLCLNHFNGSKLMFGRTLRKLFFVFVSFFCGIVKLINELRHTFFINLLLQQKINLRSSGLFYKNLRFAAGKFVLFVVCSNAYARPLSVTKYLISFCKAGTSGNNNAMDLTFPKNLFKDYLKLQNLCVALVLRFVI